MFTALQLPTASDKAGYRFTISVSSSSLADGYYAPSSGDFINAFYSSLKRWSSETAFSSDPDEITGHEEFLTMVKLAPRVFDLIIEELKKNPSALVWVLEDAFNTRPYNEEAVGNFAEMANAWVAWAERNGRTLES